MAEKCQMNVKLISNLPPGTYQDAKQHGLRLKVGASIRWEFYAWVHGAPRKKSLGVWPGVSIAQAQKAAAALLNSEPPSKVVTLADLATLYTSYLEGANKRGTEAANTCIRLNWQDMAGRDIRSIQPLELLNRYNKIVKERGPHAGRSAITGLRTMFHYAIELQLLDRNPAKSVRLPPVVSREVVLAPAEQGKLREALKQMPQHVEDFFLLALTTGIRRANLSGMRFEWIDWDARTVTIPADKSKNGQAMVIPLCDEAWEILRRRNTGRVHVFPGRSSSGHLVEPWSWMKPLREAVGRHFTIHDMRRTYGTDLTERGAPITVVALCLGHKNIKSTPIYSRPSLDSARKWL